MVGEVRIGDETITWQRDPYAGIVFFLPETIDTFHLRIDPTAESFREIVTHAVVAYRAGRISGEHLGRGRLLNEIQNLLGIRK